MNTSFGETLRKAREAKGLTTSQVAAQTRMLVQIVEEMENEDFHRIAAPIYGRGFVRLYAECVGMDPVPLVKEFMEIYEGRRAPTVRTREVPTQETPPVIAQIPPPQPQPEPPQQPEPEPIQTPEPAPEQVPATESTPELVLEPEPAPEPESAPEPEPVAVAAEPTPAQAPVTEPQQSTVAEQEFAQEPPPVVRGLDLFESAAAQPSQTPLPPSQPPVANVADIFSDSPYLSTASARDAEGPSAAERFRSGLSSVSHGVIGTVRDIPRSVWRIALLAIAVMAILAVLVLGCLKLYQATSVGPANPTQQPSTPKTESKQVAPKQASKQAPKQAPKQNNLAKPSKAVNPQSGKRPLRSSGQKVPPLYVD